MCLCLEPFLDQNLVLCLWDIFFWLFTKECNWSRTLKRLVLAPSSGRELFSKRWFTDDSIPELKTIAAAFRQDGYTKNKSPAHHKVNMEISTKHTHHPIYDQFKCVSLWEEAGVPGKDKTQGQDTGTCKLHTERTQSPRRIWTPDLLVVRRQHQPLTHDQSPSCIVLSARCFWFPYWVQIVKNRLSMLLDFECGHFPCLSPTSSDIRQVITGYNSQQMKRFLFLNELFLHGGPGVLRLREQQAVFDLWMTETGLRMKILQASIWESLPLCTQLLSIQRGG